MTADAMIARRPGVRRGEAGVPAYLSAEYFADLLAEAKGLAPRWGTQTICDHWMEPLPGRPRSGGAGLAILFDDHDGSAPSDAASIEHAAALAGAIGLKTGIIGPGQIEDLPRYDGLWIRCHTAPNTGAYRFARYAEALGLQVLDDSAAIRCCGNKAYQAMRLARFGVGLPRTVLIDPASPLEAAVAETGLPLVLKQPDGSFSRGVRRAGGPEHFAAEAKTMFSRSNLLVAQAFMPTAFDWRIGLLAGQPLFACRYHMAPGHWQILKHENGSLMDEGPFDAVDLASVPPAVLAAARQASLAMGGGLHGVDLKEGPEGPVVIEVNDNPDLKHGIEDLAAGDEPWLAILGWFRQRMAANK